jgi:iron complex outermembrane receptor protein
MPSRKNKNLVRPWVLIFYTVPCMLSSAFAAEEYSDAPALEEVIVTAQKRGVQNLQDVAMSAAVISSEVIDLKQLVGMDDYLRTIPSVNFQEYGAGRSSIIIRGISADPQFGGGTTGVYIDEVPLSGLGDFETSSPDVKLVDVNRVEILRGPQGTLYGSSSMGGTVRIITEEPRLDEFSGSVAGALSYTDKLGSWNYDAQGIVNIPLKQDVFAIRAAAYYFDNSGYYENVAADDPVKTASAEATGGVVRNRDDVGSSTYGGGRITALWVPTDPLSIQLMYFGQKTEQEGNPYGDPGFGKFQQSRYTRYSTGRGEFNEDDLDVLNLQVEYDFGAMSLLSSTSWNDYRNVEDWDVGRFWTFVYEGEDAPIWLRSTTDTDSFVQEARLASQWDRSVNFLAGVFYEDRRARLSQLLEWDGDPAYDPFAGELLYKGNGDNKTRQLAFFGELYWDISDTLTATAGMRHFDYKKTSVFGGDGFFNGGPSTETGTADESGNNYKLNISYRPNEQSLYYAQWSEGFRLGEPTPGVPDFCDADGDGLVDGLGLPIPTQLNSDGLDAWEIGSKLSFMDNRVEVRAAAFYNQWSDFPITLTADCGFFVAYNAGEAETRGVELEGSAQLSEHWRLDFSVGYLKGELTADAPGLGLDGDRLPGSPEYTASLGLQYDFLLHSHSSFIRGDLATVGGYYNNLQQDGPEAGDYTTLNLAGGMQLGHWDLQVFMQNVTNSSAATWISPFTEYGSAYRLRPRTTGFSLRYAF